MRKPAATSHRGVTRQAVAEAAADLVASKGLEALSVRQVANRLGVWPTTVMHHAGGRRDGLLTLLIEHLAAGISTEAHGNWRTRLTELAREIRRVALAHRGLADQLLRSGATGPQALRLAEAILGALEDAGLAPDHAQDAYDLFLTYVLGSAGRQTTATAPARWRAFGMALDHAEADAYPALRRAARSATTRDDDARFAGGLDLVLDAIADRSSRSPDPFRERVELSEIDPAWPEQYAEEAARIEQALEPLAPEVDHIGSTSVPVRGKPIIDIQVAVDERHVAAALTALRGLGYAHHGQGGVPGREYLTKRPPQGPAVNVHVFGSDNPLVSDNRMIRDYLRAHPEAAAEYVKAKQQAVEQGHVNLLAYSDAKRSHVAALRDAALAWAERPDN